MRRIRSPGSRAIGVSTSYCQPHEAFLPLLSFLPVFTEPYEEADNPPGFDLFNDGAAAAAGAVYGTVAFLWEPIALGAVLLVDSVFPTRKNKRRTTGRKEKTPRRMGRKPSLFWDLARWMMLEKDKGKAAEAPAPMPQPVLMPAPPPMSESGLATPWGYQLPPGEPVGSGGLLPLSPAPGMPVLAPLPVVKLGPADPWSSSLSPGDPVGSGGPHEFHELPPDSRTPYELR